MTMSSKPQLNISTLSMHLDFSFLSWKVGYTVMVLWNLGVAANTLHGKVSRHFDEHLSQPYLAIPSSSLGNMDYNCATGGASVPLKPKTEQRHQGKSQPKQWFLQMLCFKLGTQNPAMIEPESKCLRI